jgi:hypothetical protein
MPATTFNKWGVDNGSRSPKNEEYEIEILKWILRLTIEASD